MTIFGLVGVLGVALNLISFFLLQNGTLAPQQGRYAILQIASCALLLISLIDAFNFSALLINIIAIALTFYGFIKFRLKMRESSYTTPPHECTCRMETPNPRMASRSMQR